MDFCKKWLRKHQKFLLHFLIDVLMLCSKFELIPTSIFRVTAILKFKKSPCTIAYGLCIVVEFIHLLV